MKKRATRSQKELKQDSAQTIAVAEDPSFSIGADTGDLARLVWKYFSEEITQAVTEVQRNCASDNDAATGLENLSG